MLSARLQETLRFHSPTTEAGGLPSSIVPHLRETHGLNEFTVAATEHILIKFAKQIYENPLILLLLGSAVVSLIVGNTEDAVSICVAVIIVLTGTARAPSLLINETTALTIVLSWFSRFRPGAAFRAVARSLVQARAALLSPDTVRKPPQQLPKFEARTDALACSTS